MNSVTEEQTYNRQKAIIFQKTNDSFGGLSNMASGYTLLINNIKILTSEALYQACRFPHLPYIQHLIIEQKSPMAAKMVGKPYRKDSRKDWDEVRVIIMEWCLRVKFAQNWNTFGKLLKSTGDLPIVEESKRDGFWGAKPVDDNILFGANVLGGLLMKLRSEYLKPDNESLLIVKPPQINDFILYGNPIDTIIANKDLSISQVDKLTNHRKGKKNTCLDEF